jgi:nonribosomal peptide synthetase MxcG
LAHARYGLDPQHLDIRCAIGRCLSTEAPTSSRLFIQSPEGTDERLLLAALADKRGVDILSPQALPLPAEWSLNAAIFNVPNEATQYASWLDALSALLHTLPCRVNHMIFMHDTAGGARLTQGLLRDFRHERLLLLHKVDARRQAVDAGVTELIALSARLGYFPHIRFDTANERLNGCVLRIFGFDDGENIDHRAAFTMAQRRNPGVQLCSLAHWLNLISAHSDKRPNKSGRTAKTIDVNMEGAH